MHKISYKKLNLQKIMPKKFVSKGVLLYFCTNFHTKRLHIIYII